MNWGTTLTKSGRLSHCRTLADLVVEYHKHFSYSGGVERSEGHHDPVVDFCREAPDLLTCIRRAVDGRRRDGKVFSEGSCVRTSSKKELEANLTNLTNFCAISAAEDFEQIYEVVYRYKPWGIGNLTVYNVTARIAAYKGIHPERFLYLHAGPLVGWKRMTGTKENIHRVPLHLVPEPLRMLPPHKIEDFLCEFRDILSPRFV